MPSDAVRRTGVHRRPSQAGARAATAARFAVVPAVAVATLAAPLSMTASAATTAKTTTGLPVKGSAAKAGVTVKSLIVNAPTKTPLVMAHPTMTKRSRGGAVKWVQRRLGVKPT